MAFNRNLQPQGVLLAHEVGHNLGAQHLSDKDNQYEYIMETKISTGADGFGSSSSKSILTFLGRSDVTCDVKVSALMENALSPTEVPVLPPTNAPVPSPTRIPPLVSPPTPAPTGKFIPPFVDCYAAVLDGLPTCIVHDKNSGFVCFDLDDLVPSTCKVRFYVPQQCEMFSSRRALMDEGSSHGSGITRAAAPFSSEIDAGSIIRKVVTTEDAVAGSGVDTTEDTFDADNCKNSCLYSQKRFCLRADQGSSYKMAIVVLKENGEPMGDIASNTLTVETTGSECAVPKFQCMDD